MNCLHTAISGIACHLQARSKPILIGQAILYCNAVRVRYAHMSSRGVWGHAPPEKFLKTTHH